MGRGSRVALVSVLAVAAGCALVAKKPDTPAARVSYLDLNDPAPPGERYYLLVFGAQTTPKLPRFTHTWVTFARVPPAAPGCHPAVESHTISWLPDKVFINTLRPCVEPGRNFTLHETLRATLDQCERVSLWGPYEVPPGLYRKLLVQKGFVESGAIGYQCVDTIGEAGLTGAGSNCIHAISDADSLFGRQAYPLAYFGDAASQQILRQLVMRGAVPDPATTHDWLIPALGLDAYPVTRRKYTPPLFPWLPRFAAPR
jgi:hypothetical protein